MSSSITRLRANGPRASTFTFCIALLTACLGCQGKSADLSMQTGAASSPSAAGTSAHVAGGAGGTDPSVPGAMPTGGATATSGASGAAGAGAGGANATPRPEPSDAANPGTPPEVRRSWQQWPLPGKDYHNSRYTQDSPIRSSNVADLEEAWRVELTGIVFAYGMCSTAPIIVDGTVYLEDLYGSVRAIDLQSGKVKWTVEQSDLNPGPNGVAVGWGKVFAIRGSDSVVAYDSQTGKELWAKKVVDTETAGIDIQPTVFDDEVLVSTVPISTRGIYTAGDRGILKALDQETGAERWRFDTIDTPADVWGDSSVNSGGGSWYPPSIDVDSGVVFWAVANPAPFPGTFEFPNGASRMGDNLYTDSTLALDLLAGGYQWHHQHVAHDLFDRDLLHTMLTEVGGVPIVVSTGKEGRVWANRRDNGKVLWGPVAVGMHDNDELTALDDTTPVLPGSFGGVLTPPALADGVAYVATLNAPATYQPDQTAYFGSEIGTMNGNLVAIDVATGAIRWSVSVEGDPTGGVTVVNDLVFTATFQGKVFAFERETGKEAWRWTAPGGINSWLSVAGDTIVIPVGSSSPAVVVALRVGSGTTGGASGQGGGGAGGSSGSGSTDSSFSSIYRDILAPKCAGPLCHGSNSTAGSLKVGGSETASTVRSALLDLPASGSECASSGMSLVIPGDPSTSLLYRKLTEAKPPCGSRMPPTGPLSAQELDRIRTWIEDGAADD